MGLDITEHGLPSAYSLANAGAVSVAKRPTAMVPQMPFIICTATAPTFSLMDVSNTMTMDINENTDLGAPDYETASQVKRDAAIWFAPKFTPSP